MTRKPRVFLDTSALFAGIWSAQGGARLILVLGEAAAIELVISSSVLSEIEGVIRRKAPPLLADLVILLDRCRFRVVGKAPLTDSAARIKHPGDAQILADAQAVGVDFFVTLDRAHFLAGPNLEALLPFPMGTPGDFLEWYRDNLDRLPDPR